MLIDTEVIKTSSLFDASWYKLEYIDVELSGIDPLTHYCTVGWLLGRSPGPHFNAKAYLADNKDVAQAGLNPLWHYEIAGRAEGRRVVPARSVRRERSLKPRTTTNALHSDAYQHWLANSTGARSPSYAPIRQHAAAISADNVKAIAFYLPQFHPIPENDANWGKGFTEWTNVSKAAPQFKGHYQPRLPGELGFYDLRLKDVMTRQIELAKLYGIYGFCFHYYWFSGHRVLETPLDAFLTDQSAATDFPFCLCWANENWTKRWDGADDQVILAQEHSLDDHSAVFEDLNRYFEDPRYIKVGGCPLIVIYRPMIISQLAEMVSIWRTKAIAAGYPGIHLVATTAFGFDNPHDIEFDAICEFPPHAVSVPEISLNKEIYNLHFSGKVFDYSETVDRFLNNLHSTSFDKAPDRYPGVMMGWDNEARRPGAGNIYTGCTPRRFYDWIAGARDFSLKHHHPDSRFIFVNAWNEWAEGTYLEPDREFGYSMLTALASALEGEKGERVTRKTPQRKSQKSRKRTRPELALICHVFYPDLIKPLAMAIAQVRRVWDCDVIASLPNAWIADDIAALEAELQPEVLLVCENRGRDILPFMHALREARQRGYQYGLKLHSKKSPHTANGASWRESLFEALTSNDAATLVRRRMTETPDVGIMCPEFALHDFDAAAMRDNAQLHSLIVENQGPMAKSPEHFVAGSMFWFRLAALEGLLGLGFNRDDFGPELGAIDGTLAHAVERAFTNVASAAGFKTLGY